jgi:Ca2+-binding EF-hand superfamily protein
LKNCLPNLAKFKAKFNSRPNLIQGQIGKIEKLQKLQKSKNALLKNLIQSPAIRKNQNNMDNIPAHLRDSFTPAQLQEHKELFTSFDTDGGGTIDAEEMTQLAKTLGLKMNVDGARQLIAGKKRRHYKINI